MNPQKESPKNSYNEFQTFFMEDIESALQACFEHNGSFSVYPKGKSMLPTLKEGRNFVTLLPPKIIERKRIYLYKRPNGQFALHRLIKKSEDSLLFSGDAQLVKEKVYSYQLLAMVDGIYQARSITDDSSMERTRIDTRLSYKLFVFLNSLYPFRFLLIKARAIKNKLTGKI